MANERFYSADYVKFARKLLDALRDSIEVDLSPANEAEVRPPERFPQEACQQESAQRLSRLYVLLVIRLLCNVCRCGEKLIQPRRS